MWDFSAFTTGKHTIVRVMAGLLVVVSAVLRFTNLNWDAGHQVHPDEALIVNGAMKIRFFTDLNPGFHDYNGFPVYLLRASARLATAVSRDPSYIGSAQGMTIVGRTMSAAVSTISVALMYLLALQFFAPIWALICAAAFAFSPILIQLAHFYTTDTLLVACVIFLMLAIESRSIMFMAIPLALALATKNTGYVLFPIPVLAILLSNHPQSSKIRDALFLCVFAGIGFFLLSPHTFVDFSGYLERSRYLNEIATGKRVFDWGVQFIQTNPLYWAVQTVVAFGPMAIVGPVGLVLILRTSRKVTPLCILSVWTLAFAASLSFVFLKFIRYSAPLAVGYALGFSYIFAFLKHARFTRIFLILLFAAQMLWGVMFFSIYLTPHTTLQAGSWIATNIPDHSTILFEEWNSIIRYDLAPVSAKQPRLLSFNFYAFPESEDKMQTLATLLSTADYIVFDSPKVRNTILRLSDRYPFSSHFYRLLSSGKLGFTMIHEFSSYPSIGSLALSDEGAEETFYVFDHPTVRMYRNDLHFSPDEEFNLLKAQ